jgi:hypothetical protein
MISLPPTVKIFLATQPADMRKSFDGLKALVEEFLDEDPLSGHLFVFRNRRGDRLKILYWDRDGLAIWYNKLESHNPRSFLFTETGGCPDNLARWPAATRRMDGSSTIIGPRRRPMPQESAVIAPPRAAIATAPSVSISCGDC